MRTRRLVRATSCTKHSKLHFVCPWARLYVTRETMLKIFISVLVLMFASNSHACFQPPEGLIESHQFQAKSYFTVAIVLLIAPILLRLISNRNRVWVPLLFAAIFTYFPAYLWHRGQAYSSACGIPEIVLAFQILAGGYAVLFIYEAFYFYKNSRSKAT